MPNPPDFTASTPDEIRAVLEKSNKAALCLFPWERIVPIQSRVETNMGLVTEYQGNIEGGDNFPPSKGIYDLESDTCFLYDGIHTGLALQNLGKS